MNVDLLTSGTTDQDDPCRAVSAADDGRPVFGADPAHDDNPLFIVGMCWDFNSSAVFPEKLPLEEVDAVLFCVCSGFLVIVFKFHIGLLIIPY